MPFYLINNIDKNVGVSKRVLGYLEIAKTHYLLTLVSSQAFG